MTFAVHGESLFKAMHERLVAKRSALGDEKFIQDIQLQSEEQCDLDYKASNA